MPNKKQKLVAFSVRLDASKIKMAKKLNIDLPYHFRSELDHVVWELGGWCPTCKRKRNAKDSK